jgi:chromosome segregation ATPase
VVPERNITKTALSAIARDLKNRLYTDEQIQLLQNRELKLISRPGETSEDFALRCRAAAEEMSDQAAGKLRQKLESQLDRIQDQIAAAEDRVRQAEIDADGRKQQQMVDIGASLLGGLLGGRRRSRSLASAARRMSSGSRQAASSKKRLDTALNRLDEKSDDLEELEAKLADSLIEIDDEWTDRAESIEELAIGLEKNDITVDDLMIVWISVS